MRSLNIIPPCSLFFVFAGLYEKVLAFDEISSQEATLLRRDLKNNDVKHNGNGNIIWSENTFWNVNTGSYGNGKLPGNGKENENNKKRIIVKYKNGKKKNVKEALGTFDSKLIYEIDDNDLVVLEIPVLDMQDFIMQKSKDLEIVEEDPIVYPLEIIQEKSQRVRSRFLTQEETYGNLMINADKVEQTGAGVTVCIIDSGISTSHPDLQLGDRLDGESDPDDDWSLDTCGHGTRTAGIIAAQDNDIGILGVAPGVNIYTVKVFDFNEDIKRCTYTYGSTVLNAAYACKDAGANIVSMSLAADSSTPSLAAGWKSLLEEHNVLSIASTGNGIGVPYSYPASHDSVISVAAVDSSENIWSQSQQNDQVDIAAPGVSIRSLLPATAASASGETTDTYAFFTGTSMSTPFVTGVAALIWEKYDTFSAIQVRQQMLSTAKDLGAQGRDDAFGHGLVDALAAMSPACSVDSECNDFDDCTADTCVDNVCYWTLDYTCKYQELTPSTPITISEDTIGAMQIFLLPVKAGDDITCTIGGGSGDGDLYTLFDQPPTSGLYNCRPLAIGSEEECSVSAEENSSLFVGVEAFNAFSDLTLECVIFSDNPDEVPTDVPTELPTKSPSAVPSAVPTVVPTVPPTEAPISTDAPTISPSDMPSALPSVVPTVPPTPAPISTDAPTFSPSDMPSAVPSVVPTVPPTSAPVSTTDPTFSPSTRPSAVPSVVPTFFPTLAPVSTLDPTISPSAVPSAGPTISPTEAPNDVSAVDPTVSPSAVPSAVPSVVPSISPTAAPVTTTDPTISPSAFPSAVPSLVPTISPTAAPVSTSDPAVSPAPSLVPTVSPTEAPNDLSAAAPTVSPSKLPSAVPSIPPSTSAVPSAIPTLSPDVNVEEGPTTVPSDTPSAVPTLYPSDYPSDVPSAGPTLSPSSYPSDIPSVVPTVVPSTYPSSEPSVSIFPSVAPSDLPSVVPTNSPSAFPSNEPSVSIPPSVAPSVVPSSVPTESPTTSPSAIPSASPVVEIVAGSPSILTQTLQFFHIFEIIEYLKSFLLRLLSFIPTF